MPAEPIDLDRKKLETLLAALRPATIARSRKSERKPEGASKRRRIFR